MTRSIMRQFLSILLLLLSTAPVLAQRQALKNLPYIDQRRLHYGFQLGINMGDITFEHSGENGWCAECPSVNPAFCVGLMGDVALTENLNIRSNPMLTFMSRDIHFRNDTTGMERTQTLKSNYLTLPLSLKVATHRVNNYRPYMLLGGQLDIDMAHEKESPIVFRHVDVGLHVALGCDCYLPYFKFCPEIRFSIGLLNMLDRERKGLKDTSLMPYTKALSHARNKSLSFIFFFE